MLTSEIVPRAGNKLVVGCLISTEGQKVLIVQVVGEGSAVLKFVGSVCWSLKCHISASESVNTSLCLADQL